MSKVAQVTARFKIVMSEGYCLHLRSSETIKYQKGLVLTSGLSWDASLKITAISRGELFGKPGGTMLCFLRISSSTILCQSRLAAPHRCTKIDSNLQIQKASFFIPSPIDEFAPDIYSISGCPMTRAGGASGRLRRVGLSQRQCSGCAPYRKRICSSNSRCKLYWWRNKNAKR